MQTGAIFGILVLIFSVILHEVAHGYAANWLGDPTARLQGRLSLNPLRHIDPVGTILLPAILVITHSPIFIGYAKPVNVNPYNLRGFYGEGLVAAAGPATNLFLAIIFGLAVRFMVSPDAGLAGLAASPLAIAFGVIAFLNLMLGLFNLIPFPPLDGSKVLSLFLGQGQIGRSYDRFRTSIERMGVLSGTLLVLIIFYFFAGYFIDFLYMVFQALTGLSTAQIGLMLG